jgi:hypothetical protein
MGRLAFPLDAELTGPDRVVLNILQKEYELHKESPAKPMIDAAEDSDDSGVKHSEFVTPSPEGMAISSRYRAVQGRWAQRHRHICGSSSIEWSNLLQIFKIRNSKQSLT